MKKQMRKRLIISISSFLVLTLISVVAIDICTSGDSEAAGMWPGRYFKHFKKNHSTSKSKQKKDSSTTTSNDTSKTSEDETSIDLDKAIICDSKESVTNAIYGAKAGDVILIRGGTYEGLNLYINDIKGDENNYVTIRNYPNEKPVFQKTRVIFESNCHYIKFEGLNFEKLTPTDYKANNCIEVCGGCTNFDISNISITSITCTKKSEDYINPLVIYGDKEEPIHDINITGCDIHDCFTGYAEALTINGNVEDCTISKCKITNNGNIGIDIAGNYDHTGIKKDNQARNITVIDNDLKQCCSPYATSAALYCDGARDVTFTKNRIYDSDCGICLGAEQDGADVCNNKAYNNLIVNCGVGVEVGAWQESKNQPRKVVHTNNKIYNNTIVCLDQNKHEQNEAIYLTNTSNLEFHHNVVCAYSTDTTLYEADGESVGTTQKDLNFHDNCYYVKNLQDGETVEPPEVEAKPIISNTQPNPDYKKDLYVENSNKVTINSDFDFTKLVLTAKDNTLLGIVLTNN